MDFTQFTTYPILDGHIHFQHLERMDDICTIMQTVPYSRINLVCTPDPDTINHNPAALYFKAHYPDKVYISGALDYSTVLTAGRDSVAEQLAAQITTLKAMGFDGLKLIEGKPTVRQHIRLPLDAPEYAGMWATLEELGFPVVFHVADPEEFWDAERCPAWARERGWFYGDGTYPAKEALYAEVDHILARNPRLKLIFAHFYFLSADLERAACFLDAHPTVCFDLTPGIEMYYNFTRQHADARAFFNSYQDRLVYGTDISSRALQSEGTGMQYALTLVWAMRTFLEGEDTFTVPNRALPAGLPDLQGLGLPSSVLDKIYHGNFERLYSPAPVSLNLDAVLAELDRLSVIQGDAADNPARRVAQVLRRTQG